MQHTKISKISDETLFCTMFSFQAKDAKIVAYPMRAG